MTKQFFRSWLLPCLIVPVLLFGGFIGLAWFFAYFFGGGDQKTTDLAQYSKIIRRLPAPLAGHFPRTIPQDPARARFYYFLMGGFGQGGGEDAELWQKLDPPEIERLYTQFSRLKLAEKSRPLDLKILSQLPLTTTTAGFTTPDRAAPPSTSPPADEFVIFKLAADEPHNDSYTHGAAINKYRSEIIYFAHFSYAM